MQTSFNAQNENQSAEIDSVNIIETTSEKSDFSSTKNILPNINQNNKTSEEDKQIEQYIKENNLDSTYYLEKSLDAVKKRHLNTQKQHFNDIVKSASIPKIFLNSRAKDFTVTENNEVAAETAIKSITKNDGLYIYGDCGTGKTMLSSIIANERAELLKPSIFIGAVDIFHELNPYMSDGKTARIRKDIIKKTPCLIIDDLGAEKPSDWTKQTLFEIIDYRYRENLQTIITSNFNIEKLQSRLSEYEGNRIIRRIKAICKLVELNHY